jgi:hypothetical protein
LRMSETTLLFKDVAEAIGCGVATMPDAKGLFRYYQLVPLLLLYFYISYLAWTI